MAKSQFNEKENKEWLEKQPKKSVFAKAIIKSNQGRILLVKPTYKKSWQLPGGGIEASENPIKGLVRELKEEISLEISQADIELVGTVFRQDYDHLILVYALKFTLDEKLLISFQEDEIEGYSYEEIQNVGTLLSDYWADFWQDYSRNRN
jgi:ADP-ribose pyrophosphatase YjhB (NUDIX family)